jgi:hypothetical protein
LTCDNNKDKVKDNTKNMSLTKIEVFLDGELYISQIPPRNAPVEGVRNVYATYYGSASCLLGGIAFDPNEGNPRFGVFAVRVVEHTSEGKACIVLDACIDFRESLEGYANHVQMLEAFGSNDVSELCVDARVEAENDDPPALGSLHDASITECIGDMEVMIFFRLLHRFGGKLQISGLRYRKSSPA